MVLACKLVPLPAVEFTQFVPSYDNTSEACGELIETSPMSSIAVMVVPVSSAAGAHVDPSYLRTNPVVGVPLTVTSLRSVRSIVTY